MDIKKMPEIKNISKIGKEKILLLALAGIMLVGASYFENIKDKKCRIAMLKPKQRQTITKLIWKIKLKNF